MVGEVNHRVEGSFGCDKQGERNIRETCESESARLTSFERGARKKVSRTGLIDQAGKRNQVKLRQVRSVQIKKLKVDHLHVKIYLSCRQADNVIVARRLRQRSAVGFSGRLVNGVSE